MDGFTLSTTTWLEFLDFVIVCIELKLLCIDKKEKEIKKYYKLQLPTNQLTKKLLTISRNKKNNS